MTSSIQKIIGTFLLTAVLLLGHFAVQAQQQTAEVIYAGTYEPGTVLLKVVGYGRRTAAASEEAQTKAFQTLLFRGVPGSQQPKAIIENESSSLTSHAAYWEEFFQQKRFKSFLMQATPTGKARRKHGKRQAVVMVKINVDALRKDLEQNQLVRKFGL